MYKLYGQNKKEGWEIISNKAKLEEIEKVAVKLDAKEYYSYIIKESTKEGDKVIKQQTLKTEEDQVKEFKEKYKVKTKTSRSKKKEETRKIIRDYLR